MNELVCAPVVSIAHLCVGRPAENDVLLRDSSLDLSRGEVVLLVGPVGSGKSTLLRILSGLLSNGEAGWRISGQLTANGRTSDLALASGRIGAMVFQEHGLFDDLTIRENLDISASHAERRSTVAEALAGVLMADIPPDRAVTFSSGGQKQLVAIARTLLANPPALLLDEPNSGLDAAKVVRLAGVLDAISNDVQCPLLITAHHVQHLLPIADRVIFLDPREKRLIPLALDINVIEQKLRDAADDADLSGTQPVKRDARAAAGEVTHRRSKLFWLYRFFREYMWSLCLSPEALLYMALGGLLVGFVSTWFTLRHFPLSSYLTPLFHQELLAGIGFVQFRILVPLIVSILLAARTSAIIAADLGHRVYSKQIDAMRNLGIAEHLYLTFNIFSSNLLSSILFVLFIFPVSARVSLGTWTYLFPEGSRDFWKEHFFSSILADGLIPTGIAWVFAKVTLCSIGISAISLVLGFSRKASVIDLNRGIALAVVASVALTLLVQTAIAFAEF